MQTHHISSVLTDPGTIQTTHIETPASRFSSGKSFTQKAPDTGDQKMTPIERAGTRWVRERRNRGEISKCTVEGYSTVIRRFAGVTGPKPVKDITRRDIERFLAHMQRQHLAPGTVCLNLAVLRSWGEHLVDRGTLKTNPARGVRGPKRPSGCPRPYNTEQMQALFAACQSSRDRLIIELAAQLGLRASEICGLEVGDIDFVGELLLIRHGKGSKEAVMPLTVDAVSAIRDYLAEVGTVGGPLIRSETSGLAIGRNWVSCIFRRVAYEAGVKVRARDGVNLHAVRHTFATDVYARTRDPYLLRDGLRHADISTGERYAKGPAMDELRQGIEGRHYR